MAEGGLDGVECRARIRDFKRYRHSMGRERQLGHGCSPLHFTLRRRHGSQALEILVRSMALLAPWAPFRLQFRCAETGRVRCGRWCEGSAEVLCCVLRNCVVGSDLRIKQVEFFTAGGSVEGEVLYGFRVRFMR